MTLFPFRGLGNSPEWNERLGRLAKVISADKKHACQRFVVDNLSLRGIEPVFPGSSKHKPRILQRQLAFLFKWS